jgi:lysine 2,3-aminomutase
MYCRFCTRKRKVSDPTSAQAKAALEAGLAYITSNPAVKDVVISGGDPLSLSDERLSYIFKRLHDADNVVMCRIGSRNLVTLPQRITPEFASVLREFQSHKLAIFFNTHFNHPREITEEAWEACDRVAASGTPIQNQMVLLKGVNDDVETVRELNRKLLRMRVKPYYIYQCDLSEGISHFRTPVEKGLEIMEGLRGHMSGLAVPYYVIDAPGGGGKIPVVPEYVRRHDGKTWVLRNFQGREFTYVEP